MCDIFDKEFEEKYLPFHNDFVKFLNEKIVPDAVIYYLINSYERKILCETSLKNHINSVLDYFNFDCEIEEIVPKIEEKLLKNNLKIVKNNPLLLQKIK